MGGEEEDKEEVTNRRPPLVRQSGPYKAVSCANGEIRVEPTWGNCEKWEDGAEWERGPGLVDNVWVGLKFYLVLKAFIALWIFYGTEVAAPALLSDSVWRIAYSIALAAIGFDIARDVWMNRRNQW